MVQLKNIFVGFLVSFIGSIPLGYLNVIGFQIYNLTGINNLILFLFGVATIEAIVIYCTILFANYFIHKKQFLKIIEIFSIVFLFFLSIFFYLQSTNGTQPESLIINKYITLNPLILGLLLSCSNFVQIPFWTGWNLYLINNKFIDIKKKLWFLSGTFAGTFLGMLIFVLTLHYFSHDSKLISMQLIAIIIPIIFLIMGLFQLTKFYRKYYNNQ